MVGKSTRLQVTKHPKHSKFAITDIRKKLVRNEEARRECRFLLVGTHKHLTSIAMSTVHAKTSLLYTFQHLCKLIKI